MNPFEYIINKRYPNGASANERRAMSDWLNDFEMGIFYKLPWALQLTGDQQDELICFIYDIRMRGLC